MFGLYLDIQKQLILEDLQDAEVKGRWKRFVGKWNRGELAEGWYDPSTKQKAIASASIEEASSEVRTRRPQDSPEFGVERKTRSLERDNESDDDVVGPALPGYEPKDRRVGPAIPNMQDLALQRELALDDRNAARDDIRYARKLDRKQQKEQVDDLVPRAEAGTRERQLEKKKEVNDKMRSFREKSPSAVEEVGEGELMGDDGVEGLKAKKKEFERKKNEREIRKEEMLRARAEEREERLQEHRAKEDKTMAMLKALAKQNFG
ncbi:MAG: hypothetical protein M1827_002779 [Pycnora praestabilis]|nr:MAG: hypothetical protein M1827_002779 [Pycnora praestabilis]